MLAPVGGLATDPAVGVAEVPRRVRHPHDAGAPVVDLDDGATGGGPLRPPISRTVRSTPIARPWAANAASSASRSSNVDRPLREGVHDDVEVAAAVAHRGQPWVVDEVGPTHGPAVRLERAVAGGMAGDHDAVALPGRQHGVLARQEARQLVVARDVGVVAQEPVDVLVDGQHRLDHRELDPLAAPGLLALVERGEHADDAFQPGVDVAVGQRVVGVVAASRLALQPRRAALRVHHRCVGPAVDPRPRLAVAGDRDVHEPRVAGGELLVPEPEAAHDTRAGSSR